MQDLASEILGALDDDEQARFGRAHLALELPPKLQAIDARRARGADAELDENELEKLGGVGRCGVQPSQREPRAARSQRGRRQCGLADARRAAQH